MQKREARALTEHPIHKAVRRLTFRPPRGRLTTGCAFIGWSGRGGGREETPGRALGSPHGCWGGKGLSVLTCTPLLLSAHPLERNKASAPGSACGVRVRGGVRVDTPSSHGSLKTQAPSMGATGSHFPSGVCVTNTNGGKQK